MVVVETRDLIGSGVAGLGWAVAVTLGGGRVDLFMASGTDPGRIAIGPGVEETGRRSIAGAPILYCQTGQDGPLAITVDGVAAEISRQVPETDLFSGLNVGMAIRNHESAQVVADWLRFHMRHHAMNGALIVDRDQSGELARELGPLVGDLDMERVVVLTPDFALGRTGLPDEAHPFCAPDAPGKDRMQIPPADPWRAPLGEVVIYELLKALYLSDTRAVANIDPSDLVGTAQGPVFDAAVASKGGLVMLSGRHCYPWRVRKGQPVGFGGHNCVQFDAANGPSRWCFAPAKARSNAIWRHVRVFGIGSDVVETFLFMRFMGLRHDCDPVSKIVPKSSLVENPELKTLVAEFGQQSVPMPKMKRTTAEKGGGKTSIVTTMKNEGPFILEWLAYHRIIGVDGFLVYTNDCTDGTDQLLDVLQEKGLLQHRQNDYRETGMKPQHSALRAAQAEPIVSRADWVICMDVDEFINIKVGAGTLRDLYAHMGDANMISCTWRLFGNGDIDEFEDTPVIRQFERCAPELTPVPHQAWGFKTLFRNEGIFRKLGVHRPKGLNLQLWEDIRWVNGSGVSLPSSMFRNAWRSTRATYGYDAVSLNHYVIRSAESFLVKRDRGRVNHVDRDQGLNYWFRMNNNGDRDVSIQRMLPALYNEIQRLMDDQDIAAAHASCVTAHRDKISDLKQENAMGAFHDQIVSTRMQRLSRMHRLFRANVFQAGPDSVSDEVMMAKQAQGLN